MGIGPFIPLIAAGIQAGGQVASAKLAGRGGGASFLQSLGPILEAEAQRRAGLLEQGRGQEDPISPTNPLDVESLFGFSGGGPLLDREGSLGGLDILSLLRRQAFGGEPTGGAGFSPGSFF